MAYKVFVSNDNNFNFIPETDKIKRVVLFKVVRSKGTNTTKLEGSEGLFYNYNASEWGVFYRKNKDKGFKGHNVSKNEGEVGYGSTVWYELKDGMDKNLLQSKAIQAFIDYENDEISKLKSMISSREDRIRVLENFN